MKMALFPKSRITYYCSGAEKHGPLNLAGKRHLCQRKEYIVMTEAKDFLVETKAPEYLDETIQTWGAALVGGGMPDGFVKREGYFVMRCFGDAGFIKFAIENQGYGKVIRQLPELV